MKKIYWIFSGTILVLLIAPNLVRADHYHTICTTPEAYEYIMHTREGEIGRAKGRKTAILNLGSCRHIRKNTVVEMQNSLAGIVCVKSDAWKGCRYLERSYLLRGKQFAKKGWRITTGFKKLRKRNTYIYLGDLAR